jgi:hypothetical protein
MNKFSVNIFSVFFSFPLLKSAKYTSLCVCEAKGSRGKGLEGIRKGFTGGEIVQREEAFTWKHFP